MIAGHFGIAFGLRAARRDVPLVPLLVASILPDIVDMAYAAARFCSPMGLYSHSPAAIGILACLTFAGALIATGNRGASAVLAIAVLLHAPADWITGEKLLWTNGPVVGFGLYRHPVADFLLEVPIAAIGWQALRRDARAPRWAVSGAALALLIAGQAAFDGLKLLGHPGKPSGCVAGSLVPGPSADP